MDPGRAAEAVTRLLTLHGWSPAAFDTYPEQLATLERASIRSLLAPCTGHESVVAVGDKVALTAGLKGVMAAK